MSMRSKTAWFLAVCFLSAAACAPAAHAASFQEANQLYKDNKYDQAIELYRQIAASRVPIPEVYFNLGNAYFKSRKLGHAILYYEKAKLLSPNDEDINRNLAIANARIVDKIDMIPDFFIKRWLTGLVNLLPSNTWAILSLVFFTLAMTLLLLYFFSGTRWIKRFGFYSAMILLTVSLLTLWTSSRRAAYSVESDAAIVIEPSVTIKSSPDEAGNNIFVLHEGTRVIVTDSIENWKQIRLSDGNKGWVQRSAIEPV